MSDCPPVPGAVIRPLVDPVPLYPWALVHRAGAKHPELATLRAAAAGLASEEGWLESPDGAWLPGADARWAGHP